jgi:hypothetical protein
MSQDKQDRFCLQMDAGLESDRQTAD